MNVEEAAQEFLEFLGTNRSMRLFSGRDSAFTIAKAYKVASCVHKARVARGEIPVGRKIGFTNQNIWREYGVQEPIWGYVYDKTLVWAKEGHACIDIVRLAEPRIEPEVVLHFKSTPPVTRDETRILECIDWIAQGFEIVQSPFPNWRFQIADTVAVNGLHGLLIVGTPVPVVSITECVKRLRNFRLTLKKGEKVVAEGCGADVLGSPLLAFAHLAHLLEGLPEFSPVTGGELVTTGTLTTALPIAPGETWSSTISGINLPGLTVTIQALPIKE